MKMRTTLLALALTTVAGFATADHMKGVVVRLEPGKVMVVRGPDMKEMTYTLSPDLTVPSTVVVGQPVEFETMRGTGDTWVVTRVTTTTMPDGSVQRTTDRTTTDDMGTRTTTRTTTIDGVVKTYDAGKSITLTRPDGTMVTYVVNDRSQLPADLAVGKKVYIRTVPVTGSNDLAVEQVTYTTKTKTKSKTKDGKTETETKTKTEHDHQH
jgi:hypothetical protein